MSESFENRMMRSIACKYCDRLKNPEYRNSDMARCFKYDSCINPNDKCSRFILDIPESMINLTGPLDGYTIEGNKCVRPDGSFVISLNDVPEIRSKIEEEEKRPYKEEANKAYKVVIIVSLVCCVFFFIYGSSTNDSLSSFMGWVMAVTMIFWIVLFGIYNNRQ